MRTIILIAALGLATPAWAQQAPAQPAPRPLPADSIHWDGNRKDLKGFRPPSSVTIDGVEHNLATPKSSVAPAKPEPEPEKKPAKGLG